MPQRLGRLGRPKDETITDAIYHATLELLVEAGYAHVTMEAIAARAAIAKPTLYSRYKSLADIVVDIIDKLDDTSVPAADTGSFRGDLIALLEGVQDLVSMTPFGAILPGLVGAAAGSHELSEHFQAYLARRRKVLGVVFERAMERGELPADTDTVLLLDLLVGPIYFRFLIAGESVEGLAEQIVDTVLYGIGRRRPEAERREAAGAEAAPMLATH